MRKYLKYLFFAIAVCGFMLHAHAQDEAIPKELYTSAGIPDSLKENANSVVRYSSDEITIEGPGKAVIKHHSLVTILNEKGDDEAIVEWGYNRKNDNYSDVEIRVYDSVGTVIKKYHKSDMYDGSAIDDETLATDDRFLALKHVVANYPSTIEVEYEEDLSSFISLENWYIQNIEQSVQNEVYEVMAKPDIGFRYDEKNINIKPVKSSDGDMDTYTWHISNLKAIKKEDDMAAWSILPYVLFGTNKFDCYGYPGDISTWENLGKWIYGLNSDVCTLNPQRTLAVQQMTDTIKTPEAKAKFLYQYLQQNTRYVSIQLGIGGWKPFDANFVDAKKYGDCKALANYMYALLKAVNIPSYWVVVTAGTEEQRPVDPQFPNNSFNHEILCIPFKNDTTWIDCTSTTQPFGQLGPFTENRKALMITPDGGRLVNTPKSTPEDNQFNSEVHLQLDSDGSANAQVKILCTGVYRYDYLEVLPTMKTDEQKEQIMHNLNIRQAAVFNFNPGPDKNGVKEVDLSLQYDNFCDIMAGDKQFYRPHVLDLCTLTLPIEEKRKTPYYFETPLTKTCVTTIDLPAGYVVETLPENESLKFTYGNYDVKYVYDTAKNQVISTAKFNLNNRVIPAAKYNELQQYLDAVIRAQNKKLVIRKKA